MSEHIPVFIYTFLACLSFCVIFKFHKIPHMIAAAAGGMLSWVIYVACGFLGNDLAQYLISTIIVSAYAEVMARVFKAPVTGFLTIGILPLVMVSPADSELIAGGSDERRRFMDVVISQYDKEYLEALIRYNKALAQRNTLLKSESPIEEELFLVWEEMMAQAGEIVFRKREAFIEEFIPIFQSFYSFISQDKEQVGLSYDSHARDASLLEVLKQSRERDKIMGFSLRGIHKDELNMLLGDFPIKKEGSQGQNKTYLVALKLAQFDFLKRTGRTIPLLLLDDIFDKLDASRVEQIVKLVAGDSFGQIFITDTNREHLDRILQKVGSDYKIFRVDQGVINEMGAGQ